MRNALDARLKGLVADFTGRYSESQVSEWIRRLWQSDRWSDYTAFHRTAEYAAEELRRLGLRDVEIVPCPADGRTRMQAWTMPLAWEAGPATLRMVAPFDQLLCDRQRDPLSVTMWCEPTPSGGLRGPLVVVDNPKALSAPERRKLRGAFLLTGTCGRGALKVFAHEVGAAAIVSAFVPHAERHIDALGWSNGWADDEGGWALKASDCRMSAFNISPVVAARLRRIVADGPVICEAKVGGRIGKGTLPVVTAVLPGRTAEEVLLDGHLYEIGVLDNASGCAAMMEGLRLMAAMPKPRRTVRILLTAECYGTYAFFTRRPALLRRTLAGLNVDCVGQKETPGMPLQWHRSSEANPSAADTLFRTILKLTERCPGGCPAQEEPHGLSDNAICDPAAGVSTVCLMRAPWAWHTSLDDWSQLDALAQKRSTVATAAYARWLADALAADADALAAATVVHAKTAFAAGTLPPERRAFFLDRARTLTLWTLKLGAKKAAKAAAALPTISAGELLRPEDGGQEEHSTVPVRSYWGACTFDNIPLGQRDGFADPRWNMPYVAAGYWADGRRSIAEIAALVRTEYDKPMGDLLRFFRVLERGGMVSLKKRRSS